MISLLLLYGVGCGAVYVMERLAQDAGHDAARRLRERTEGDMADLMIEDLHRRLARKKFPQPPEGEE